MSLDLSRPEKETNMTHLEIHDLERNEAIIDKGMRSFVEVGEALQDIRHRRLWRNTHETFELYLRDRWAMGAPYATRLIKGSEVAKRLPDIQNEAQAREINKVPYTDQEKVLVRAISFADIADRPMSAKDIRLASKEPSALTARPQAEDGEPYTMENLSELWSEYDNSIKDLKELSRRLVLNPQGCWLKPHIDTIEARLKDCERLANGSKPHAPCSVCAGGLRKGCEACRDRGWLPQDRYDAVQNIYSEQKKAQRLSDL